jgi:hypothetical protein
LFLVYKSISTSYNLASSLSITKVFLSKGIVMTKEECDRYSKLGYDAAKVLAANIALRNPDDTGCNVGAANTVGMFCRQAVVSRQAARTIIELQQDTNMDFSSVLVLSDEERDAALAALSGGAMRFAAENPDKKD